MIYISDIIKHFKSIGTWVNWDKTRDVFLFNEKDKQIDKIGVCWVLTDKALDQAIASDIKFVISHENCFYFESTHQYQLLLNSRKAKQERLLENDITVYRSHDVWDYVVEYGNLDSFTKALKLPFKQRSLNEKYNLAYFDKMKVRALAERVVTALSSYGQDYCEVLGDVDREVTSLALGIGAACNVFELLKYPNVECLIVSDDGACNWVEHQYCLDNNITLIIVHHSINEILGMNNMVRYLKQQYPKLHVEYLDEGFHYHLIDKKH